MRSVLEVYCRRFEKKHLEVCSKFQQLKIAYNKLKSDKIEIENELKFLLEKQKSIFHEYDLSNRLKLTNKAESLETLTNKTEMLKSKDDTAIEQLATQTIKTEPLGEQLTKKTELLKTRAASTTVQLETHKTNPLGSQLTKKTESLKTQAANTTARLETHNTNPLGSQLTKKTESLKTQAANTTARLETHNTNPLGAQLIKKTKPLETQVANTTERLETHKTELFGAQFTKKTEPSKSVAIHLDELRWELKIKNETIVRLGFALKTTKKAVFELLAVFSPSPVTIIC